VASPLGRPAGRCLAGRIIGFNVRADSGAREAVKETGVEIRYYSIIYEAIDDVKQQLSGCWPRRFAIRLSA